ncbi:hypothetical protein GIX45_15860 [Erwinia sp. CPCC 100877]|nr:hypothetical protein [Erwinia sp. CPCC 100877]
MDALEAFSSIMEPKIKVKILDLLNKQKYMTIMEIRDHFPYTSQIAIQYLWMLCNDQLILEVTLCDKNFFTLTNMGESYLQILKNLVQWEIEHYK